jgi:hypothetical protein
VLRGKKDAYSTARHHSVAPNATALQRHLPDESFVQLFPKLCFSKANNRKHDRGNGLHTIDVVIVSPLLWKYFMFGKLCPNEMRT